jgi:hypothetical protein
MNFLNKIPTTRRELELFYRDVARSLGTLGGIAWEAVSKAGSKLSDLEQRTHVMLQNILGTGDRHITQGENVEITALHALDPGLVAKSGVSEYTPRSIQGTAGEIGVSFGDGQGGDPTIFLPDLISGPRRIGGEADYTEVELDGTMRFQGAATVYKDVMFPMAPPKTTGAGNPTLTTYNGNLRGYSFAVNDAHDFDPQEQEHDSKVGSIATFHVHWLSRSNDGTERAVKWEIEYDVEPESGALPATVTASVEVAIPAGSAVNTVQRSDITTFTVVAIARLVGARIKRVASAVAAPSVDPILRALHFHYELDTIGSRGITSK